MSKVGDRFAIYEATNNIRRESLVISSTMSLVDVQRHLDAGALPEIAGWKRGEYNLEQIAANLPKEDAQKFAANFVESLRAPEWKATVLGL